MAAAVELAERGVPVTVFEASRTLGGRARRVEVNGVALDNGLHI
jgi:phytoene dehydrogenase-like protein